MAKQTGIIATVFGGAGDEQPSAYGDVPKDWPAKFGVALPYRFSGTRPKVRVYSRGLSALAEIVDVGPWNTHDNYWDKAARPQAESGADMSGRHTNGAGIDLTPALAQALGIDGKGMVDWEFESGTVATLPTMPPVVPQSKGLLDYILDLLVWLFKDYNPKPTSTEVIKNDNPAKTKEPLWMYVAKSRIGFHEKPNNQGLEELIADAHTGSEGDPWCAIFVNACLEKAGIRGTRSPAARSFEHDANFIKLEGPAYGAIVTNWRGSPNSGLGHVFFYAGESSSGLYALGGNQSDQVKYEYEPRDHVVAYWWPKAVPLPTLGSITATASTSDTGKVS